MGTYVYEVHLNKYNSPELYKRIHLIARGILEATHLTHAYVYELDRFPEASLEIASIKRIMEIEDIINASLETVEDEEADPFNVEGMPDDDLIIFKHSLANDRCNNIIKVQDNDWDSIQCPTCKEEILRDEVTQIAGTWCFVPLANKRKKK